MEMSEADQRRFYSYIVKDDKTGCWNWAGTRQKNRTGMKYGYFSHGGKMVRVNRLSYASFNGAIPEGHVVRHRCDNPLCANPAHLETGTQKQNVDDRYERGRDFHFSGEAHPRAKITERQADEIAQALIAGSKINPLAREYGVSSYGITYIRDVRRRAMIDAALEEKL